MGSDQLLGITPILLAPKILVFEELDYMYILKIEQICRSNRCLQLFHSVNDFFTVAKKLKSLLFCIVFENYFQVPVIARVIGILTIRIVNLDQRRGVRSIGGHTHSSSSRNPSPSRPVRT